MEVLSDILRAMRVEGSVYFCDKLEAPWRKDFTETTDASFHMIRRGECWASVNDNVTYLGPGDLIFLAPGVDHVLTSDAPAGDQVSAAAGTMLLCGYCSFAADTFMPLADIFPQQTIIRAEELDRHVWLKGMLDQLSSEYLSEAPGSELVVNKLTEVVLIELVRINFCREQDNPFLLALNDDSVSKALTLIHAQPQQSWTLESLASEVALSRAAFAKRFTSLVGQSMYQYLTAVRMERAREFLSTTQLPVYEVASRSGYESELAFKRVFKKYTGETPNQYRKR
ncbi:MAG: AraC family transcriptional regulator [Woeseiaceae bacterium]|nr:AraC family transcriptional regulator [Woeseiaceae bacterium]